MTDFMRAGILFSEIKYCKTHEPKSDDLGASFRMQCVLAE